MPKSPQDFNMRGSGGKISEYLPEQNAQRIRQISTYTAGGGNIASNQGTDGVGVYDAKVGVDLQFRHVAPASSKITVVLNGKDIDIDIAVNQILHNSLGGLNAGDSYEHITQTQKTALHPAITVTAPISLSTQLIKLVNDAAATITEFDTGALAASNTKVPTSAAVKTYADAKVSDAIYEVGWDGVGTIAPSKNAVYDITQKINNNVLKRPVLGTYTGNGAASQAIALGWRPACIYIVQEYGGYDRIKMDTDNWGASAVHIIWDSAMGDYLEITATGFNAKGTGNGMLNKSGETYDYVAWYSGGSV